MEKPQLPAARKFVDEIRSLYSQDLDPDILWDKIRTAMGPLLVDPELKKSSKTWPLTVEGAPKVKNLLFYEDPDYGFAVNGLTKGAARQGVPSRIHDHAHIYTLYGVLDGHERIERYERLDDGSKPDYAEIRLVSNNMVEPGEIDLVGPYEIHTENTVGERTVAVIIRSEKSGGFNQGRYIPETNQYYESLGPRQTPVEMFPSI